MVLEEIFLSAIANVGFPITITIYLLIRFEKVINSHTNSIKELIHFLKKK